jgi:integrase
MNAFLSNKILSDFNLSPLPSSIIDRAGNIVDVSGNRWMVGENSKSLSIKWDLYKINNQIIEYAFKRYFIQLLKTNSPGTAHTFFHKIVSKLTRLSLWKTIEIAASVNDVMRALSKLLGSYLQSVRESGKEYEFAYVRAWYKWCNEQDLPGFSAETLYDFLRIKLQGNPQGVDVLSENKDEGPLTHFEVTQLRNALIRDKGPIIERLCLWLSLSYGCNPANFVLLKESDFIERHFNSVEDHFFELKIPRIKKRAQTHKRTEFKVRKVDARLADLIKKQIAENVNKHPELKHARPLLMRKKPYAAWLNTDLSEFAYHISTGQFLETLNKCIKRLNIISPRTGQRLHVTPRRLRYTYATAMVKQGASAVELAELLDHTDLQNVRVYFNARSEIVERLDAALAEKLAPLVNAFKGKLISQEDTIEFAARVNYQEAQHIRKIHGIGTCGAKFLCHLYPPLSCYLCEKFQPWKNAPHKKVLNDLINERQKRIDQYGDNDHYAKQLDDVIYSVAQVIKHINQEGEKHA